MGEYAAEENGRGAQAGCDLCREHGVALVGVSCGKMLFAIVQPNMVRGA
jgi:hypothetical protein